MSSRREGMTTRKCGCITYEYGPMHRCDKHLQKDQEQEEIGLRKAVKDSCEDLGHHLSRFEEYESNPGKWTAYCLACGLMAIVYDQPPVRGDQIAGWCLSSKCSGQSRSSTAA